MTVLGDPIRPPSANQPQSWVGLVEDDASLRAAIGRALRVNGIRVECFGSAEEFLRRTATEQPECVVLDIHLGGLSGFDLQDLLADRGMKLPIIFITGHDFGSHECLRRGAYGYLRKPFDTNALVTLLRPHLRFSRCE